GPATGSGASSIVNFAPPRHVAIFMNSSQASHSIVADYTTARREGRRPRMTTRSTPDRIDTAHAALIAYDVCRRALTPADAARRAAMRPVLDAWVALVNACRARSMHFIYTQPV